MEIVMVDIQGKTEDASKGMEELRSDLPKEFKGTRVAKDVDNFIWSMETYFRAMGVKDDAVRVGMDLHKAMSTAESLVEFRSSSKSDSKEKGKPKGGGDQEKSHRFNGGKTAKSTFKDKTGSRKPKGKDERMLKKANRSKGVMFADVEIAGKEFSALVDIGFSNLFISEEGAKKLGLRIERTRGRLKTVDEDAGSGDGVPAEVAQVLDSFKDVMLTELPKKLPPKREVDHRIEL
ncbi:hypothetical protein CRG98_002035, partial [Punica granatum]